MTQYWFLLDDDQVLDLGSGYVPKDVRAMMRFALESDEDDRRRAEAIKHKTKKTKKTHTRAEGPEAIPSARATAATD